MDGRTDGRTEIFTQYSGISSCSLGSTDNKDESDCVDKDGLDRIKVSALIAGFI